MSVLGEPEGDGDVTVYATATPEPLCSTCGRIARVWPSTIIDPPTLCGDFEFHGFTGGEDGTIAQLYDGLFDLAARLRGLPRGRR